MSDLLRLNTGYYKFIKNDKYLKLKDLKLHIKKIAKWIFSTVCK